MDRHGLDLAAPRVVPILDSKFSPAVLARRAFLARARVTGQAVPAQLAIEQADGAVFGVQTQLFPEHSRDAVENERHLERLAKFLLWSIGGHRIYMAGPRGLAARLQAHYQQNPSGKFDSEIVGRRIHGKPVEVVDVSPAEVPSNRSCSKALGRHLEGCRIGFDLGGSDRKVAAVQDGKVIFSEEQPWDPSQQSDPQYHIDGIQESLRKAAAYLPRVDAIGGSAAGVYVNNEVKVASLFRAVPQGVFERRVKKLFLEIQKAWGAIPFEVVNDGEVTALAGSMRLGKNAVLGLALGTSLAAGYVTPDGKITSWLNELAFTPIDYSPQATVDEWSGDRGVGVQYLSQQAVCRLLVPAGISSDPMRSAAEKLQLVQELMASGDERAQKIYQTLGTYLGYAVADYACFYDFNDALVLGRVMSGPGGEVIIRCAREVLKVEFPELENRVSFHVPDEKLRRHGQAIAAASLPPLPKKS
ncbi:MAG TPA: ROK family protein [Verrucomicrobiae bacterium]|nr:ROK family protein [Verrucomicrobiae bacterium]